MQAEVPSQAVKWVTQSKFPLEHPAPSFKSCGKLAGSHLGDSKSNHSKDDSRCSAMRLGLPVPCSTAWHGLARRASPAPAPGNLPKMKPSLVLKSLQRANGEEAFTRWPHEWEVSGGLWKQAVL